MKQKVARVGAIRNADENTVYLYGYGKYVGDEESPLGFPNPKIMLDNGDTIWGFECWWASEEKVKTMIGDRQVVIVPVKGW